MMISVLISLRTVYGDSQGMSMSWLQSVSGASAAYVWMVPHHQPHTVLLSPSPRFPAALHTVPSLSIPVSLKDIPPSVARALEAEDSWDFNIFQLEAATHHR